MTKRVLLVEDSQTMRGLIVSTLEQLDGIEVMEAPSGFFALKVLPREKFDLILTDINMPDINGLELVNFVKRTPQYKDTPIFIISTEGSERDRDKGMQLGANEYLVKPFDPEKLLVLVKKYLAV
ncbi:MAG: response regulator [Deltaproteobacteria bacterium]|nr:response regulator [Deltaproteobacteria bacterium]